MREDGNMQEMLTCKDVQEQLGVSRNTAYKLIRLSGFPKIKIGHSYRIPRDKFEAYILEHNKSEIIL